MCGIVGVYRFDECPIDAHRLQGQIELLNHRGPDAQGRWIDGRVGLGNTRLSILDLSEGGRQPMISPDGRYVLIYNGEVYNFQSLKRSLRNSYVFRGTSDTEVLLYSFVDYGVSVFEKFEGMYALALYDQVSRRLWLVRDSFGIKPLYYHRNHNRLVFASEIKPLLLDPETPRRPNYHALRQHLFFGYSTDPDTAFEEIYHLPPGHYMEIAPDGTCRTVKYWDLQQLLTSPTGSVQELLDEGIALHSISDVPTGLFLSSGLDSSMILASLARQKLIRPDFRAYNVGVDPDDPTHDTMQKIERGIASRSCQHYGVPLVKIHPLSSENISLADITLSLEEPICNPTNVLIDAMCSSARAHGTTVLLSGHGGDEVFAGYRRHIYARYLEWLIMLDVPLVGVALARLTNNTIIRRITSSLAHGELHPLISISALGWDLVTQHEVSADWFSTAHVEEVATPLLDMLRNWRGLSFLKQAMLLDMRTYLIQNLINMDKSSMRRSVEVRVPYLYRPLVATGLQSRDSILVSRFRNKAMIRDIAQKTLPDFLCHVPKLGFGPPEALVVTGEEVKELLLGYRTKARGMFRTGILERLLNQVQPTSYHLAVQLYNVAIIEQWFRSFIDDDPELRKG
jgi:asparagine synthase (glutamine-hydrolysing)